ncbi:Hypothetical predicted protein [Xyrichtys novacula]|uniref:Uncharacterized protein n=1 Tax=Xyrichtys novacula TaxID=13765 RepID=A0AAV1GMA3_XYRNO|nr:Hypothetical predicted protein [Xyrichtys novacula]
MVIVEELAIFEDSAVIRKEGRRYTSRRCRHQYIQEVMIRSVVNGERRRRRKEKSRRVKRHNNVICAPTSCGPRAEYLTSAVSTKRKNAKDERKSNTFVMASGLTCALLAREDPRITTSHSMQGSFMSVQETLNFNISSNKQKNVDLKSGYRAGEALN